MSYPSLALLTARRQANTGPRPRVIPRPVSSVLYISLRGTPTACCQPTDPHPAILLPGPLKTRRGEERAAGERDERRGGGMNAEGRGYYRVRKHALRAESVMNGSRVQTGGGGWQVGGLKTRKGRELCWQVMYATGSRRKYCVSPKVSCLQDHYITSRAVVEGKRT